MSKKGNTYKEEEEKQEPKKVRKSKGGSKINFEFLKDQRTQQVAGLFLMLVSVILFAAFTSYLFTWKADHDKVTTGWLSFTCSCCATNRATTSFGDPGV